LSIDMSVGISKSTRPVLPLQQGDRLTRAEFERRFDATPGLKRAELLEGVVYMPPPVSHDEHSGPHFQLITWLGVYAGRTPGVAGGDNGSLRLDLDNMPQPDAYLMIDPACGGQARLDADGYVAGAPELVAEVSASSVSIDLHLKKNLYRRHGVREYLVWRVRDEAFDWFVLRDGEYVELADERGIFQSGVFPGLRLDAAALLARDLAGVQRALNEALGRPDHVRFVEMLKQRAAAK
jgi:Uma2 family endonuclease